MFIDSARNTMTIAQNKNQFEVIEERARETLTLLNHRYMTTSDSLYTEVAKMWSDAMKADFNAAQAASILSLYARERIALTLTGAITPELRQQLLDVLAHFLVGCHWPTYGDTVDMDRFLSLLQHMKNSMEE